MRTFDATLHNQIAAHPEVAPMLGYDRVGGQPIDFAELAAEPDYFVLLTNGEDACMVFELSAPFTWQMHTLFAPTCRGRRAITTAKGMIRYMLTTQGALMVWGMTPVDNRAARLFNRWLGATSVGIKPHAFMGDVEWFCGLGPEWLANNPT
jgi:hypothetical protein